MNLPDLNLYKVGLWLVIMEYKAHNIYPWHMLSLWQSVAHNYGFQRPQYLSIKYEEHARPILG